jgi:hypothetical protein
MSALNVTQEEAQLLITSLNMYAEVHKNASGVVPEDVAELLVKLIPAPAVDPAPVVEVVVEAPVVEEVVEEKPKKSKVAAE